MDTPKIPPGHRYRKTGVGWPVTVLTPDGPINGEIQNICPAGVLMISRQSPPMEALLKVLIKAPDRQPLQTTAKVVLTSKCGLGDGVAHAQTLLHFSKISPLDRKFLYTALLDYCQKKLEVGAREQTPGTGLPMPKASVPKMAMPKVSMSKVSVPKVSDPKNRVVDYALQVLDVRIPVFYNKGGKTIKALGNRFSTKGCHIYTTTPPPVTAFSLRIENPQTHKSIQVDSSVIRVKRFTSKGHWGLIVRFMNLTETGKEEFREILKISAAEQGYKKEQKCAKTQIGHAIRKYFKFKKALE
ncbi:MAG: PilZ domain-containing protein [Deltaproteobacteria bacterium]|nr:MAG: PilZ domain-containing protein [Deltaproteobacteria bacterium]